MSADTFIGGRYRLIERIGVGSMATVHRARDEFLGRDVAVKLIRTAGGSEADRRRTEDEVQVLARLNHHNLVTLLDAGADRTDPEHPQVYLVMELIEGPDLRKRIALGALPQRHIAQIGLDVAEGLDYVHAHGLIHRDVKPANIVLFDYPNDASRVRSKLADFGIASMVESTMTQDGLISGTAAYLSPEQVRSDPVGPPSDVYSLGLVLLQCFTGTVSYPGPIVESAIARLVRPPEMPEDMDPQWAQLVRAMTAIDPAERPTAREVAEILRAEASATPARHKVDPAVIPSNEVLRMEAVHAHNILDTPPDGTYDRVTALAARLFSTPVAIVTIVDHDRIWFKSHHGIDVEEIGRDAGLCASAILQNDPWIIADAPSDPRTLANPLVAGAFGLGFYAGVPLHTRDGYNLGTLCVLDYKPRTFSEQDVQTLEDLAAIVMNDLELRLESRNAFPGSLN